MELYLIRHPRPEVLPGTCYGQTDLGLAESPLAVAERIRPLLPGAYALYASPLRRARLLAEALGCPEVDPRLMEIHFGEWEGRSFDEIGQAALGHGSFDAEKAVAEIGNRSTTVQHQGVIEYGFSPNEGAERLVLRVIDSSRSDGKNRCP